MGSFLISIIPDILPFVDRLEPNKGKQARYLMEHLSRQRTLASIEKERQKGDKGTETSPCISGDNNK